MKQSLALVTYIAVAATAAAKPLSAQVDALDAIGDVGAKFEAWAGMFGASYASVSARARARAAFAANDAKIAAHNARGLSWALGHNKWSDLTADEWKEQVVGGPLPPLPAALRVATAAAAPAAVPNATSLDWVAKGAVTPVKDQAQCGSCWAFSTTGSIEGAYQQKTGKLVSFSEQDLVSCDFNGDQGCNGGLPSAAYCFVRYYGLTLEADYPYTAGKGVSGVCRNPMPWKDGNFKPAVTVDSFVTVDKHAEVSAMKAALALGPVSIGIEADKDPFQLYKSGVIDDAACGTTMDHAVLAVGYGVDTASGKAYWKVKNSWGPSWGEAGYVRMVQGKDMCGIADSAVYPTGVADWSAAAAQRAPTAACPAIAAPPPPLPKAYSASVKACYTKACGYPLLGNFSVSASQQSLRNNIYNLAPGDEKLQRCDLGHNYYVNATDMTHPVCAVDPTAAASAMVCPWTRGAAELMSQFNTAAISKHGVPCEAGGAGSGCDEWVSGAGSSYVLTFVTRNNTDGTVAPVREVQTGSGAYAFQISYVYSDVQVAEPPAADFAVPALCKQQQEQQGATQAASDEAVLEAKKAHAMRRAAMAAAGLLH